MVLGFEVSRRSKIKYRACSAKPFSSRKWENPAIYKASASRTRSQMGSIPQVPCRNPVVNASTPSPMAEITPRPVITIRSRSGVTNAAFQRDTAGGHRLILADWKRQQTPP